MYNVQLVYIHAFYLTMINNACMCFMSGSILLKLHGMHCFFVFVDIIHVITSKQLYNVKKGEFLKTTHHSNIIQRRN